MNLIKWVPVNLAGIFGIVQAVVKLVKEVLTVVVNILFPLFPDEGKFEKFITKMRSIVNVVDSWIETIKGYLLK
jgi:hypothetical protein